MEHSSFNEQISVCILYLSSAQLETSAREKSVDISSASKTKTMLESVRGGSSVIGMKTTQMHRGDA